MLKVLKLAQAAKNSTDPLGFIIVHMHFNKGNVETLAIPLAAHALVFGRFPASATLPKTVVMFQALAHAKTILQNIAATKTVVAPENSGPTKMVTEYPDNPMSDRTRAEWIEYRQKNGSTYVGARFIPPGFNKRYPRFSGVGLTAIDHKLSFSR